MRPRTLAALLLAAAIGVAALWAFRPRLLDLLSRFHSHSPARRRPWQSPLVRDVQRTPFASAVIVNQLREASRLITLVVQCGPWEEKIEQKTVIRFWPDPLEEISAITWGEITYGIDLAELKSEDILVSENGRLIRIRLPEVRKMGFRLDLERCRIVGHSGSWYWSKDPTLRDAILKQAEARLATLDLPKARDAAKLRAERAIAEIVGKVAPVEAEVEFVGRLTQPESPGKEVP